MTELLHLQGIFERLRKGHHLSREDEPEFSALDANFERYTAYFAPLGLTLVRHPRDFFYFAPASDDVFSDALPRIAVFSYILVDHASSSGRTIDDFFFSQHFIVTHLPHFNLDRYRDLLKQVDVRDVAGLKRVLHSMKALNWIQFMSGGTDEFRFLRPFYRMLDKCIEVCESRLDDESAKPSE